MFKRNKNRIEKFERVTWCNHQTAEKKSKGEKKRH